MTKDLQKFISELEEAVSIFMMSDDKKLDYSIADFISFVQKMIKQAKK